MIAKDSSSVSKQGNFSRSVGSRFSCLAGGGRVILGRIMTMVRMMIFIMRKNPFRLKVNRLWKSHFLVLKMARTLSPWVTGFS